MHKWDPLLSSLYAHGLIEIGQEVQSERVAILAEQNPELYDIISVLFSVSSSICYHTVNAPTPTTKKSKR